MDIAPEQLKSAAADYRRAGDRTSVAPGLGCSDDFVGPKALDLGVGKPTLPQHGVSVSAELGSGPAEWVVVGDDRAGDHIERRSAGSLVLADAAGFEHKGVVEGGAAIVDGRGRHTAGQG